MAHPDILPDPTEELVRALGGYVGLSRLHRHILAGGALPAQWRGEGTAAGKLMGDVEWSTRALAAWRQKMIEASEVFQDHVNDLGRGVRGVKGEF